MCTTLKNFYQKIIGLIFIIFIASCSNETPEYIGFSVTYMGEKTDIRYYPYDTSIPNSPNWNDESLTSEGGRWHWSMNGTESALFKSRDLPEWIEFKWKETSSDLRRQISKTISEEEVSEIFFNLPIKSYKVSIKNSIPVNVIKETLEANRNQKKDQLARKSLHLYFTWLQAHDEVRLGWELLGRDANGSQIVLRKDGYFSPKYLNHSGS